MRTENISGNFEEGFNNCVTLTRTVDWLKKDMERVQFCKTLAKCYNCSLEEAMYRLDEKEVYENLGKAYSCSRELSWCTKKVYDKIKDDIKIKESFTKYLANAILVARDRNRKKLMGDILTMINIIKNDCKHFLSEYDYGMLEQMIMILQFEVNKEPSMF